MADERRGPENRAESRAENRWETIRQLWRDERFVYQVLGGLALVGVGVWLGALLFSNNPDYWMNGYTELLSISVTVFVLNLLARRREERREIERLKADLIRRMGSQEPNTAMSAADELAKRGWLQNGTLKGADLRRAKLQKVKLQLANLQGAQLWFAELQEADLSRANLQGANLQDAKLYAAELIKADLQGAGLWHVDLEGAILLFASLQGAYLRDANLQWAFLVDANLEGADLNGANLHGADLENATFDEQTVLPDGSHYDPELGLEQLRRFTDPDHPDFWQPDWVKDAGG